MARTITVESDELRALLPSIITEVLTVVDPVKIILFGSVARGDAGPDSDIDIYVVLDHVERLDKAKLMGTIRLSIKEAAAIDVFVTDADEWDRRKDVAGSMQYWPSREGDIIFERFAA